MSARWLKWAVKKYLPDMLTGAACTGVFLTGYLGIKAGKEAQKIDTSYPAPIYTQKERANTMIACYIPPLAAAITACVCIVSCHAVHIRNEAALGAIAAAYASRYAKFDRHIKEELSQEEYDNIRQKEAEDSIPGQDDVPWLKDGEHWYYEPVSEQFFVASDQAILYAQLYINKIFQEYGGVTVNDFLNVLPGCRRCPGMQDFGWYQGTDGWEEYWGWFGMSHFIDFDFTELPDRHDVRVIHYFVQPCPPDEDWEPWK